VSRAAGATITVLVAAVLLRLAFTGTYRRYVREEMGVLLFIAGITVATIGVVALIRALRHIPSADSHDHDHGEEIGVGWLLLAPIAALLLVAPPTLGSYGVGHSTRVDVRAGAGVFDPLPRGTNAVPMTLLEFGQRSYERNGASFNGVPVQLTGFMAGTEQDGFLLARYQIACCAADAAPIVVRVVGASGDPPARDRWMVVTGTFESGGTEDVPEMTATSIVEISAPDDPYE
jgi:uncharacterized repeat protein (TIGR03943 family)